MGGIITINFDHPDETRKFPHGKADIVHVGESAVARLSLEPGWRWATDVKPIAGTESCQVRHVGFMAKGRLKVMMTDGTEQVVDSGGAYIIEPGHDAEVVGSEPVVAYEFSTVAAEAYAKKSS